VKFCHPLRDIIEFRSSLKQVAAIPFNSVNKWQLSVHEDRDKNCNVVLMKGAPEKIAALCQHVWVNGQKVPININEVEERNLELGGRGERVLAFAELELPTDKFPLGFAFDTPSLYEDISTFRLPKVPTCQIEKTPSPRPPSRLRCLTSTKLNLDQRADPETRPFDSKDGLYRSTAVPNPDAEIPTYGTASEYC
jgi:hypothetical protein